MQAKKIVLGNQIVQYYQGDTSDRENTLLFLHGWGQTGATFAQIFNILEQKNISYISLDLPGFGGTQLKNDDMTIENYGDFVVSYIEKMELKNPILIGHSFGGRISIYLGSFYTNLEKIILIGAAGFSTKTSPLRLCVIKVGKFVFSLPGMKKLGAKLKDKASSRDYKNAGKMKNIFRNAVSNDLQKYMKDISLKTLLIRGKNDTETPLREGEAMNKLIKDSKLCVLEGGHFIFQEKPEETTEFILDFIGR